MADATTTNAAAAAAPAPPPTANGAFPANDAAGQTVAAIAEADKISAGTSALKNALLQD
jgi:hypothetical protein